MRRDSTNIRPPFLGQGHPRYPAVTEMLRVTGPPVAANVYPAQIEQWIPQLNLRDRVSVYVFEPNGINPGPMYMKGRLLGNALGLPVYGVGLACCVPAGSFSSISSSKVSSSVSVTSPSSISHSSALASSVSFASSIASQPSASVLSSLLASSSVSAKSSSAPSSISLLSSSFSPISLSPVSPTSPTSPPVSSAGSPSAISMKSSAQPSSPSPFGPCDFFFLFKGVCIQLIQIGPFIWLGKGGGCDATMTWDGTCLTLTFCGITYQHCGEFKCTNIFEVCQPVASSGSPTSASKTVTCCQDTGIPEDLFMTWDSYTNPDGTVDCDFNFPTTIPLTFSADFGAWISPCYANVLNQCFVAFILECDLASGTWTLGVFASESFVTAASVVCEPFELTFTVLPGITGVRNTDCLVHSQSLFCCGNAFFTNITITG